MDNHQKKSFKENRWTILFPGSLLIIQCQERRHRHVNLERKLLTYAKGQALNPKPFFIKDGTSGVYQSRCVRTRQLSRGGGARQSYNQFPFKTCSAPPVRQISVTFELEACVICNDKKEHTQNKHSTSIQQSKKQFSSHLPGRQQSA